MYLYLCLLFFFFFFFLVLWQKLFVVQLVQIFVFQLTDMFCVSAIILLEAHRSGALLILSQAAVMGLIACGHIFLFRPCYVVRCGLPLSKHEIFLYICSVLVAENGDSVCTNICT
jgi:hypothetical protein